uniref:Methylcrotonoyl-CoA carboxylase subunit alpha, mitochondrial n=1 Tax=Spongospora subterranea TaxID=70186 RepID=A0A0H5QPJ8_9EUKA|eukprot:CRZ03527.1 hypothetical protein [Spongospora subterranea]
MVAFFRLLRRCGLKSGIDRRTLFTDECLPTTFNKILIANRGEIACRIVRTAKALGIRTVAVYSDADANAMHTRMCDEAYRIGESPAAKSYLDAQKILEVAKATGAQAVHPGYGFLSESVKFAQECQNEGIVFIGPPIEAINAMGSKSASKKIMIDAKVPVVPGYHGDDQTIETLVKEADACGFPLMIKAVLGGGGKGMRVVNEASQFLEMLESCKREALSSFGDDRVLLERYIVRPRHIEFQIFADQHGNAVHLYERDCSAQRRHQKVLEEAPAPGMTTELRNTMGKSAVDAAISVNYVGAGTVEFIFDADTGEYFFMEMNTRLQVEHPVTEMIVRVASLSGETDLVQLQLHVAAGHRLPFSQSDITSSGHCIESRIYAERPISDESGTHFLPCVGTIKHLSPPAQHAEGAVRVRVETGIEERDEISMFYDPMIAKLVVWAHDREGALRQMNHSLSDYHVLGLADNNIQFLKRAVSHPEFIRGQIDTGFISRNAQTLIPPVSPASSRMKAIAAASLAIQTQTGKASPWNSGNSFRLNCKNARIIRLECGTSDENRDQCNIALVYNDDGSYDIDVDGDAFVGVKVSKTNSGERHHYIRCIFDDVNILAKVVHIENQIAVFADDDMAILKMIEDDFGEDMSVIAQGPVAPMPGRVVKVLVAPDDEVEEGQALVIMEAMKMEHIIRAPHAGIVEQVHCRQDESIQAGHVLISFHADKQ